MIVLVNLAPEMTQFLPQFRNLDLLSERLELLVELPTRYSLAKFYSTHSKLMELVLLLRDMELLQSSTEFLFARRRRLGVDLLMGRRLWRLANMRETWEQKPELVSYNR